jgi:hypothetical protein
MAIQAMEQQKKTDESKRKYLVFYINMEEKKLGEIRKH